MSCQTLELIPVKIQIENSEPNIFWRGAKYWNFPVVLYRSGYSSHQLNWTWILFEIFLTPIETTSVVVVLNKIHELIVECFFLTHISLNTFEAIFCFDTGRFAMVKLDDVCTLTMKKFDPRSSFRKTRSTTPSSSRCLVLIILSNICHYHFN